MIARFYKFLIFFLLIFLFIFVLVGFSAVVASNTNGGSSAITNYRDLNKNGRMDIYEDANQPVDKRVADLLQQMTLEEKVGQMFIEVVTVGKDSAQFPKFNADSSYNTVLKYMLKKGMTHFNVGSVPNIKTLVIWQNNIQKIAENTRLGIPVTIASDPRNAFVNNAGISASANGFSQWCEPVGFAAIGDGDLMRKFGDIARQEYLACGIRVALHPMADLATEPRWSRVSGTFGEDAALASMLVYNYILGFQTPEFGKQSVACMTKHFSGGGPQKEGWDPHFESQKGQIYPGNNFKYHLKPFEAAFKANTAMIMPYYGVPMDQTSENVGFSFNKDIITGLLRHKYHFDGVVCTDWGLITDQPFYDLNFIFFARAWGVTQLTELQRVKKVIDAGCDMFGGETCTHLVIQLVNEGKISQKRIDKSVARILKSKFELGLFEQPYVDLNSALKTIGKADFKEEGELSQRKAIVLLKNENNLLPLKSNVKLYVENIDKNIAAKYALVVDKPEEADFAIIRLSTPFQKLGNFISRQFHQGDLDFKEPEKGKILNLCSKLPTIVDIYLDRPAVIPEISEHCKGLLTDFGASDAAVLDVVFGNFNPQAKLPFELPSSMEAVRNQKEDLPYDSEKPLYKFGFGLTY